MIVMTLRTGFDVLLRVWDEQLLFFPNRVLHQRGWAWLWVERGWHWKSFFSKHPITMPKFAEVILVNCYWKHQPIALFLITIMLLSGYWVVEVLFLSWIEILVWIFRILINLIPIKLYMFAPPCGRHDWLGIVQICFRWRIQTVD